MFFDACFDCLVPFFILFCLFDTSRDYYPDQDLFTSPAQVFDWMLAFGRLIQPYPYVRESNRLTNFLEHVCFATQNLVAEKNQFAAKITKPPPAANMKISNPQLCDGFNLASL